MPMLCPLGHRPKVKRSGNSLSAAGREDVPLIQAHIEVNPGKRLFLLLNAQVLGRACARWVARFKSLKV
jgi:hypothetical protein